MSTRLIRWNGPHSPLMSVSQAFQTEIRCLTAASRHLDDTRKLVDILTSMRAFLNEEELRAVMELNGWISEPEPAAGPPQPIAGVPAA